MSRGFRTPFWAQFSIVNGVFGYHQKDHPVPPRARISDPYRTKRFVFILVFAGGPFFDDVNRRDAHEDFFGVVRLLIIIEMRPDFVFTSCRLLTSSKNGPPAKTRMKTPVCAIGVAYSWSLVELSNLRVPVSLIRPWSREFKGARIFEEASVARSRIRCGVLAALGISFVLSPCRLKP